MIDFELKVADLNSELYHHGIKGQKWGVRRFQNADGTRTAEGKKHRTMTERFAEAKQKAEEKRAATLERKKTAAIASGDPGKIEKYVKHLTNDEIKNANERVKVVNELRDHKNAKVKSGMDVVNKMFEVGKTAMSFGEKAMDVKNKIDQAKYNLEDRKIAKQKRLDEAQKEKLKEKERLEDRARKIAEEDRKVANDERNYKDQQEQKQYERDKEQRNFDYQKTKDDRSFDYQKTKDDRSFDYQKMKDDREYKDKQDKAAKEEADKKKEEDRVKKISKAHGQELLNLMNAGEVKLNEAENMEKMQKLRKTAQSQIAKNP